MILIIALIVVGWGMTNVIRRLRREKARQRLAAQLRLSLQNMVHALRVQAGFLQAVDYVSRESDEPIRSEWKRLLQTVGLGQTVSEGLAQFGRRVPIKEAAWFVTAVQITQSTGGSLADVLETLSTTLQDKQTLRDKMSAMTAQGRATGLLLSALPFMMLAILDLIIPDMVHPLFTTVAGQIMLSGVIVSVGIGSWIIKRIVSVSVD